MDKSPSSRMVLVAVIVLAILSVVGNAAVIWVVRQNQPTGDDSLLVTTRLDGVETQLARLQAAVTDSGAAIPVVESKLTDLEQILASIKEDLDSKTAYDDTEILNKLVALETNISEGVTASRPDLSGIEDRLTILETTLGAVSDKLELVSLSLTDLKVLWEKNEEDKVEEEVEEIPVLARLHDLNTTSCDEVRLTVMRGDTVWGLARHFENPPSAEFIETILEVNQIVDPRKLRVGQELVIPSRDK